MKVLCTQKNQKSTVSQVKYHSKTKKNIIFISIQTFRFNKTNNYKKKEIKKKRTQSYTRLQHCQTHAQITFRDIDSQHFTH